MPTLKRATYRYTPVRVKRLARIVKEHRTEHKAITGSDTWSEQKTIERLIDDAYMLLSARPTLETHYMSEQEVRAAIKKAGGEWSTFYTWMGGQTGPMLHDGSFGYFRYDVDRFIKYKCNPKNEPLSHFD